MTTWLPLESNPDVLNKFIHKLGVSKKWSIVDVYGLDSELLEFIPKPVKAVILLFPCSEAYEKHRAVQNEKLSANLPKYPADLFYMKQLVRNACGTIALVHSIANNKEIELTDGSILKKYIDSAYPMTVEDRGKLLEKDTAFTVVHEELAHEGQTEVNPEDIVIHHFISLIQKDGQLFELDGSKSFPINHGKTSDESFLNVLNKYICKLGVSEKWNIVDVYGLDPELLEFIPKPVKAVILLFPCSEAYEKHRATEHETLSADPPKYPEDLFYMKQIVHNACGTIALVHSIANNKDIDLADDSILKKYIDAATPLSIEERGKLLEQDSAFTDIHQELAREGQTEANPEERVNHHFIALINKDGDLLELDGRKSFPIKHGPTTEESFLNDAAKVCKEFMERDPDEVRFTVIALTPNQK